MDKTADWSPDQVWRELSCNQASGLVDVRTRPEWEFVGVPDLSSLGKSTIFVEWRRYGEDYPNVDFTKDLATRLGEDWPETLFFICRSGVRSRKAATAFAMMSAHADQQVRCINVAEGFEGDLCSMGHRSTKNGWKFRQLPWQQG